MSTTKSPAPIVRRKKQEEEDLFPRRERRALSHVGGHVEFRGGNEEEIEVLSRALSVSSDEEEVMQDVHGFHSYPARMHPQTASRLIAGLSRPDSRVMDPFCGSGTVVVEARALGRAAIGSDLNPLSVELAWLKSRGVTRGFSAGLVTAAERIAARAEERRKAKADPYRLYDDEDRERYPIHILLELDSLTRGVLALEQNEPKRALRLLISSLLTKLSHSEGDTTRQKVPRRLAPGFAIRLFVDKTRELAERLNAFADRVPVRTPRAFVTHADARRLEHVEAQSVELIVTSPPYPGVYDYLDHHLHRLKWLGLHESHLARQEIGARRSYRRLTQEQAQSTWLTELGACLREMKRCLTSDGRGVMIIADSVVDRSALRADTLIIEAAQHHGVDIMAIASQERPLFLYGAERAFADAPRREHVVIFRPGKKKAWSIPRSADEARQSTMTAPLRRGAESSRHERSGPRFDRPDGPSNERRPRFDRPDGPSNERRPRFDRPDGPSNERRPRFDRPDGPSNERRPRFDRPDGPSNERRPRFDRPDGPPNERRSSIGRDNRPRDPAHADATERTPYARAANAPSRAPRKDRSAEGAHDQRRPSQPKTWAGSPRGETPKSRSRSGRKPR